MATTYKTAKARTGIARAGLDITAVYASFDGVAPFVANDTVEMVKIPKGAAILDVIMSATRWDNGGSILLECGDTANSTRFITASNIGQAGGLARMNQHYAIGYTYALEYTINIKCGTPPSSGTTGGLSIAVFYTMQQ